MAWHSGTWIKPFCRKKKRRTHELECTYESSSLSCCNVLSTTLVNDNNKRLLSRTRVKNSCHRRLLATHVHDSLCYATVRDLLYVTLAVLCYTMLCYAMLCYPTLCYARDASYASSATLRYATYASYARYAMLRYVTLLYATLLNARLCYPTLCYATLR